MRTQGKITHWNEEKGYGFIVPSSGAKQVFVHIRAFKNRQKPPQLNQLVSFAMSTDKQGRPCAVRVTRAGEKSPREIKRNDGMLMILMAVCFIVIVGVSVLVTDMPVHVLIVYMAASLLAYVVYAMDKSAAQRNAWRTKESTLHLLSLLGGWPGALIAQKMLRHKSRKVEFRIMFWLTVVLNVGFYVWLFTPTGAEMLRWLVDAVDMGQFN
jgi:uncharacterized membrane protein YsdA (DUF1294 family)/cold shock CspA family protein